MADSITRFVRPEVNPAKAYSVPSRASGPDAVYLNMNESPYPLSPKAQRALETFTLGNRYPEYTQRPLREKLAEYTGFAPERIAVGAGLDNVFEILVTMFISPGAEVIISDPTFGVYSSLFPLHGGKVVDVPLGPRPDFALDADGIINAVTDQTKLIMICNPNNPTGNLFPLETVEKIVKSVDVPVAIDEAYAEFSGTDHLQFARDYEHVIILRTLSKFAGLAGFRVGYAIFPDALAPYAATATPTFANISGLSSELAIASLEDLPYLEKNRDEQVAERERVISLLNEMPGVTAYPSATNFIFFDLPVEDSADVEKKLAERDIFVRRYANPAWDLQRSLRMSVGYAKENDIFLKALEEILAESESA